MAQAKLINTQTQTMANHLFWLSGLFAILSFAALPVSTTFTDVFILLSLLTLIFSGNLKQKFTPIIHNEVALLFIAFFGLYLLGTIYSSAPTADITKSLLKNTKLLYGALLIPIFLEQKWREAAINFFMIVLTGLLLVAYLKWLKIIPSTDILQEATIFKNHIDFNFLMAFFSYLLLRKCFDDRAKIILWLPLFIFASCYTLLGSQGRTGYIVFAVLILLFAWQRFAIKGVIIALTSVLLLGAIAFFGSNNFQTRVTQIATETSLYQAGNANSSVGQRLSFYKNAIALIQQHPILGSGTGSVSSQYQAIEPNKALQTHNVHNEYFNVAIQLGLVGLCFLIYFFTIIFIRSGKLPLQYRELSQAVILSIAIGSVLNSWLMDTVEGHFFVMMMALCFATTHRLRSGNIYVK